MIELKIKPFQLLLVTKLPESVRADNGLELWLPLFKAKTEEDLKKIEALEVPDMSEAIQAYRHVTVSQEFKEAERLRAKARHDEAQALFIERCKIAKRLLYRNRPLYEIVEDTGLTQAEVEFLRNAD